MYVIMINWTVCEMLHLYGYYIIPGGDMSAVTDGDWVIHPFTQPDTLLTFNAVHKCVMWFVCGSYWLNQIKCRTQMNDLWMFSNSVMGWNSFYVHTLRQNWSEEVAKTHPDTWHQCVLCSVTHVWRRRYDIYKAAHQRVGWWRPGVTTNELDNDH